MDIDILQLYNIEDDISQFFNNMLGNDKIKINKVFDNFEILYKIDLYDNHFDVKIKKQLYCIELSQNSSIIYNFYNDKKLKSKIIKYICLELLYKTIKNLNYNENIFNEQFNSDTIKNLEIIKTKYYYDLEFKKYIENIISKYNKS